jgi:VWFA-related protein
MSGILGSFPAFLRLEARVKGFGVICSNSSGRAWRFPRFRCGAGVVAQFAILCLGAFCAAGQEAQPSPNPATTPAAQASSPPASESTSGDEVTTFKVKVNMVLVRAVVRDAHGNAVGGLHQEDFELFDNGKPQAIRQFAIEGSGSKSPQPDPAATPVAGSTTGPPVIPKQIISTHIVPTRFVAYVFDDVHIDFGDLARLRDAAKRHIDALQPTDRAAIFTTSGQDNLDFTDDRAQLHKALDRIRPTLVARTTGTQCPDISYYMADLICNKQDPTALALATANALECAFQDHNNTGRFSGPAQVLAQNTATRVLMEGDHESRLALSVFQDVLRRIAAMPGQRTMLVLSPGFLTEDFQVEHDDLIERALQSQVVVSTLNPRGLYNTAMSDISKRMSRNEMLSTERVHYLAESNLAQEGVLQALAYGTGGTYYHNSNDVYAGLQSIASPPEFYYVLGFSPQNLKLNGYFHSIKVAVKHPPKLSVQARAGYYAPKHAPDPAETARQEIEDALFSREELHDLPVDLRTQFSRGNAATAQLAVLVHIDARHLHFSRGEGKNVNQLTVVSGLFDTNGRLVSATQKLLDMHVRDETLANELSRGFTVKSNFDVKPGAYLVRLVVRDAGGQISTANGAIEIP